jgi:hypothetical protein
MKKNHKPNEADDTAYLGCYISGLLTKFEQQAQFEKN